MAAPSAKAGAGKGKRRRVTLSHLGPVQRMQPEQRTYTAVAAHHSAGATRARGATSRRPDCHSAAPSSTSVVGVSAWTERGGQQNDRLFRRPGAAPATSSSMGPPATRAPSSAGQPPPARPAQQLDAAALAVGAHAATQQSREGHRLVTPGLPVATPSREI